MKNWLLDIWSVFTAEVRRVFHNKMVLLIFYVATIIYPIFFCCIYMNEQMTGMAVAVVDDARCTESRRMTAKLDATPEMEVKYMAANMAEAQQLMRDHKVHAIFYFPSDYGTRIAAMQTGRLAMMCDMSSFYYYKNAMLGGNYSLIDEMHTIELQRFELTGMDHPQATNMMQPIVYDDVRLYNPSSGFTSFFVPILLVLVVHQTLFFGICALCGEANENRRSLLEIPAHLRSRSIHRVTAGRALCFILLYIPVILFDLWLVPRWFNLPQIGTFHDIALFVLPLLLAVTFMGMTIGNFFVRETMSGVLCMLFFSVMLFFLSGMVWPQCNMPRFWYAFSYLFPSTPGIQGFVRINTMGATLQEVRHEYLALWIQTGGYFLLACQSLRFIKKYRKP